LPDPNASKSVPTLAVEFKDMVVAYAKQETVDPLKNLGRFIGFGVAGSFLVGTGVVLFVLSLLRLLQTETGRTFRGDWSFVPYLITAAACAIVIALAARAIGTAKRRARRA
jgi:cytochrome b subunit of formate dehydrogenase